MIALWAQESKQKGIKLTQLKKEDPEESFSITAGPISTKLATEHHFTFVKRMKVCTNEGDEIVQGMVVKKCKLGGMLKRKGKTFMKTRVSGQDRGIKMYIRICREIF